MADYLIHDSTLEDIADAIRAKTGGSSLIEPEDMPTEIASISGGGGSLPSIISKIDGGSFTLASDTITSAYWISHNLGVLPKMVFVWTDNSDLRTLTAAVAERYLISAQLDVSEWTTGTTTNGINPIYLFRAASGNASTTGSPILQTQINNYMETERLRVPVGSIYYKYGVEYKWVALA